MKTRLLMDSSAAFYAVLGLAATVLPQELLAHAGAPAHGPTVLLIQMLGALFVGFAVLNWLKLN
jgi:hypothetical protein